MSKPSKKKNMKENKRKKEIKKHFNKSKKNHKFVVNQKAENHRVSYWNKMKKEMDKRQKEKENRPYIVKLKEKVVQWYMRKVYSKYHQFKLKMKRKITFLKGYKVK